MQLNKSNVGTRKKISFLSNNNNNKNKTAIVVFKCHLHARIPYHRETHLVQQQI